MADTVTLRFYGRFVFVRLKNEAILVLAPRFDTSKFASHQFLMSARRDKLVWADAGGTPLTTVNPMFKMLADHADAASAEWFAWDLSGVRLSFGGSGAVTLVGDGPAELVALETMEMLAGQKSPVLAESAVLPDPGGRSTGVVEISAGAGVAKHVMGSLAYTFVTERDARDTANDDSEIKDSSGKVIEKHLAHVVEFAVTLPEFQSFIQFEMKSASGGNVGRIAVLKDNIVNFTNMCAPLPRQEDYDLEFVQYYNLIDGRDPNKDNLVPKAPPQPGLSEGLNCYLQAQIHET